MNRFDSNLKLIKAKIDLIKVGIFKPDSDNDLQMPFNVIQVLSVDALGNIWFQTTCKNFSPTDIGKNIYSYIDFKSKGFDSRVVVSGPAQIVEESEPGFETENEAKPANHILLMKLKIMKAEFDDNNLIQDGNILNKIKTALQSAFFNGQHKQLQIQSQ